MDGRTDGRQDSAPSFSSMAGPMAMLNLEVSPPWGSRTATTTTANANANASVVVGSRRLTGGGGGSGNSTLAIAGDQYRYHAADTRALAMFEGHMFYVLLVLV